MRKRNIIILVVLFLAILIGGFTFFFLQTNPHVQITESEKSEVLKENAKTLNDPAILQIRIVLHSYLEGHVTGTTNLKTLVDGDPKLDKENFIKTGLKFFSKDYYKSKFVALRTMSARKGKVVYIEFIDKPDKVF